jgi:hypothetical protein
MTPEKANEMNVERALENGNHLAFPLYTVDKLSRGLTKREYMATQLMIGSLADGHTIDVAVDRSIEAADKLLIALYINSK